MNKRIEDKLNSLGGVVPIGDSFVPIEERELRSIEQSLNTELPQDYRDFVKLYGAAMFSEYVDFRPIEDLPMPLSSTGMGHFSSFYGAARDPYRPLIKAIEFYRGRMPDTLIPIANDGEHQICLGIGGNEHAKIFYWDRDFDWNEEEYFEDYGVPMPSEEKFRNVHLIASSFEDLILRLELSKDA